MKTKTLPVELPRIDAGTQSRLAIDEDTVSDYADLITGSDGEWPFPPLDVFFDGTDHFVADGFHRLLGALRTKRGTIPCQIHKGTARDALIFGMTANDKHGLRRNRADKRHCVEWLLDEGGKMTQQAIAEAAGVSVRTVRKIVSDRKYDSAGPQQEPPPIVADRQTSATPTGEEDTEQGPEPVAGPYEDTEDYGKCPNCAGSKWEDGDGDGVTCIKCRHPHGEPAGDADEDRMQTQRQKTVKTAEALMRAFDDLQCMKARAEHGEVIAEIKGLINLAKGWK